MKKTITALSLIMLLFSSISVTFAAEDVVITDTETQGTEDLQIEKATALSSEELEIKFNQEVIMPENIFDAFYITDEEANELDVVAMSLYEDTQTVLLQTMPQTAEKTYTLTVLSSVTDVRANPIKSGIYDQVQFNGSGTASEIKKEESFHAAAETSDEEQGTSNEEQEASIEEEAAEVTETEEKHAAFFDDLLGNSESELTATKVEIAETEETVLPETGPGLLVGLCGAISASASFYLRKKNS